MHNVDKSTCGGPTHHSSVKISDFVSYTHTLNPILNSLLTTDLRKKFESLNFVFKTRHVNPLSNFSATVTTVRLKSWKDFPEWYYYSWSWVVLFRQCRAAPWHLLLTWNLRLHGGLPFQALLPLPSSFLNQSEERSLKANGKLNSNRGEIPIQSLQKNHAKIYLSYLWR